jgi:hypothetical protein
VRRIAGLSALVRDLLLRPGTTPAQVNADTRCALKPSVREIAKTLVQPGSLCGSRTRENSICRLRRVVGPEFRSCNASASAAPEAATSGSDPASSH